MQVEAICTRDVVSLDGNESLQRAALLMREHHVGAAVVTTLAGRATQVLGTVPDRALAPAVLARAPDAPHVPVPRPVPAPPAGLGAPPAQRAPVQARRAAGPRRPPGRAPRRPEDLDPPLPGAPGRPGSRSDRDPRRPATDTPGRLPASMRRFAQAALQRALADPQALDRVRGGLMTEPKPQVWFDTGAPLPPGCGAVLDRRTRMAYDDVHVFINGEAFRAGGRDARLMRQLADRRALSAADVARLSADAHGLLDDWADAGWVQPLP